METRDALSSSYRLIAYFRVTVLIDTHIGARVSNTEDQFLVNRYGVLFRMTRELPLAHYAKRLVMINHQLADEDHYLARCITLKASLQPKRGQSTTCEGSCQGTGFHP